MGYLAVSLWNGCRSSCLRQICVLLKRPAAANNYKSQRTVSVNLFFFSFFFFQTAVHARKFEYKCNTEKCRRCNVTMDKVTSKTFGQADAVEEPRTRRGTQTPLYYLSRSADDSYLRRSVRSVFSLTSALMHSNVAPSLTRTQLKLARQSYLSAFFFFCHLPWLKSAFFHFHYCYNLCRACFKTSLWEKQLF